MHHSPLVQAQLKNLKRLVKNKQAPVLDLACGSGRNGLYLVKNDVLVTFSDVKSEALEQVQESLSHLSIEKQRKALCWQIDFEKPETLPLQEKSFAAIMIFRYLHRPLIEQIKAAIKPGGMVIYETFTEQQAQFGRPKNPDFLLKPTELVEFFSDWKILHHFEGITHNTQTNNTKQAIAQIVAIKPT